MKNLILPFLFLQFSLCAQNRSLENNKRSDTLDVLIYKLHLDVTDFTTNVIKASCQVNFAAKMNGVTGISLDLLGFQVDSVHYQGQNTNYAYNDTLLRINFVSAMNENEIDSVTVYYQGTPQMDASGWGGFYFQNGFAYNLGVGFAADPHNFGRAWHPCFDNFVERAQYEMRIKTLDPKRAYANGIIIDEDISIPGEMTRTWKISDPIPSYLACFTVGNYTHVSQTYQSTVYGYSIPVMLIARPQDTTGMKTSMNKLFDAMHIYEEAYGPYLWEKIGFHLVPFNSGAMEHATSVAYPQSLGAGNTQYDWLMAHELSHHWWGNLVTCKTSSDMWINEGFATYSEAIFLDVIPGGNAYLDDMKAKHYKVLQRAHFNDGGFYPLSGVPHQAVYGAHSYEKGAVMLHNMRTYLGDSLFFVGLQALQTDFANQSVDAFEVRDKISEATGVNMNNFFDDWIMQPGFVGVVLDSFDIQQNGNLYDVTIHVKQKIRKADHLFSSFPLQISLVENLQNVYSQTILFTGETMSSTLTVPFVPQTVYLNGDEGILNAVTAKDYIFNSNGTQIDSYSYSRVTSPVSNTPENEWVRIEHCRVAPDQFIDPNLGIQISSERYWRVDGIWNEDFYWNTWFAFDGRDNALGNLDNDLLVNPHDLPYLEDSMKLLYRANTNSPWSVLEEAELLTQGSPTDGLGRFVLNNVQKGEYTFGYKYSHLGIEQITQDIFILYPNPAQSDFRILAPFYESQKLKIKIIDVDGKVRNETTIQSGEIISTNELMFGVYIVEIFLGVEKIGECKLVVESK